jgi:acyl-CoA thioester hydrolase
VTVGAQIGEVGDDRFVMRYRAVSHQHGAVAADGESLIVTFDYATGSKAPVPDDLRARLMNLRRA